MKANAIIVLTILVLIVGFASGYFISKNIYSDRPGMQQSSHSIISYDTVIIHRQDIQFKTIPKLKYITKFDTLKFTDSLYSSMPFIAELDTIIKQDTVNVKYIYPINQFNITMKFGPDSIIKEKVRIFETKYIKEKDDWYIKPLIMISGIGLGYLFGANK